MKFSALKFFFELFEMLLKVKIKKKTGLELSICLVSFQIP